MSKKKRTGVQILSNRVTIVGLLVLAQLLVFMALIWYLSEYAFGIYFTLIGISLILVIYILNKKSSPSFSMAWIVIILVAPVFGGPFYFLFGNKKVPKQIRRAGLIDKATNNSKLIQDQSIIDELMDKDFNAGKQSRYLNRNAFFPVYKNTKVTYFPLGEDKFESLVEHISNAKKYIFMEYFIIEEGKMWDTILAILIEKAQQGVDVRLIYDDAGCANKLLYGYEKILRDYNIKCYIFNPLRARIIVQMNNRDHRKICVVDGQYAYLGGINLADEYINHVELFGHWKDTAVLLEGDAVKSVIKMYLQIYNYLAGTKDILESFIYDSYIEDNGFIQPYSDSPTDSENVSEISHINMINLAKNYVYITTPYLIPSYEMTKALTTAAKNGVDVRIIVPHIPDKGYVFLVTQSNYRHLIESGVKIYEYTPGFMHAKSLIADGDVAYVGSCNMDYRSYYLHFECGVNMYYSDVIKDIEKDYINILRVSKEITKEDYKRYSIFRRIAMAFMGLFSFLM